jgi:hypothetical protein
MSRIAAICVLVLVLPLVAHAEQEGPITLYFHGADTVYLVRVESLGNGRPFKGTAKFVVIETLRGQPVASLTLVHGMIELQKGSEFLILSSQASRNGFRGNVVGSLSKGNCGWQDAPVIREDGQVYVCVWDNGDKIINGRPYLTLDHIKELLKQDADKSPTK